MDRWLQRVWYSHDTPPAWLRALQGPYAGIAARRARRAQAEARGIALPVPVIVVGNVTVGGTGKTPFTIWLVQQLRDWGWSPGVVSRGYGARDNRRPLQVDAHADPYTAGDEPVLIARRAGCPVVICRDRVAAARSLLEAGDVNLIVADDGLQHYRLPRNLEVCVVDGARGFGNGHLLPAGPLREPVRRVALTDLVVVNGGGFRPEHPRVVEMHLEFCEAQPLTGGATRALTVFSGHAVHAVAGIGHPERFFAALRTYGMDVHEHPFPDHHELTPADLAFGDDLPVLMTEKDAVKCAELTAPHLWNVPVQSRLTPEATALVRELTERLRT